MNQIKRKDMEHSGWLRAFLRELVTMPLRHVIVFLVGTLLFILLEVELTKGWHLLHIFEVLGGMVFVYLIWAAWRARQ